MKWNDFLNPRSMLTPGIAGSVVMVIANTLWVEFMVPQKWTALVLSFLLIIPILIKFSASWIENAIYFTFNGLIVFALAVNTNFAGRKLQEIGTGQQTVAMQELSTAIKSSLASTSNYATNSNQLKPFKNLYLADNTAQKVTTTTRTEVKINKPADTTQNKEQTQNKIQTQDPNKPTKKKNIKDSGQQREFFQKWF